MSELITAAFYVGILIAALYVGILIGLFGMAIVVCIVAVRVSIGFYKWRGKAGKVEKAISSP